MAIEVKGNEEERIFKLTIFLLEFTVMHNDGPEVVCP